ncbi:MAG TPA: bifunctional DNA primase/polymerase [Anaerolineaceae bacterium]|nr:bifunctional DNA primase/polymerase [Anaerolineaceae bacterium]
MAEFEARERGNEVGFESCTPSANFSVLHSAMDLYSRELNVFPVLKPESMRILAQLYPHAYSKGEKRPYLLQPLFTSRMHLCDEFCLERERKNIRKCPGSKSGIAFQDLFLGSNLGVMMGRTSSNLACIDCDSVDAFKDIHNEFVDRKLDFWAYLTSRGGNLLFQVEEHQFDNHPKNQRSDIEIWGANHFCVLPPSVHESGVIYTWLQDHNPFSGKWTSGGAPRLSVKDLDWLGIDRSHRQINLPMDGLPTWTCMLSIPNQKILAGVLTQGTRNSQLVKPAYEIAALIVKGLISEEDGLSALLQSASRAIPPYPENKVRQMMKSALKKNGLTTSREHYGGCEKKYIWDQAISFAATYNWGSHGRTALTDQAVFRACCERCRMDSGQPFRASVREISELANISSLKTTTRATRRLVARGLIEFDQKTTGGVFCYVFGKTLGFGNDHINTTCNTSVVTTKHEKPISLVSRDLLDDIFGKIGRVSRICWEYLIYHPEDTISKLAKNTKLHYHSVYYNIPRLIQLGFVSRSRAEGLFIGEDLSNDELLVIAKDLGVLGKTHERRRIHEIEREIRVNQALCQKRREVMKHVKSWINIEETERGGFWE